MLVCTLGDLLLDVVVRLDQGLIEGGDVPAQTEVVPGGQAANVGAWVAALGGRARFVGKCGNDLGSRLVGSALTDLGVEVLGPVVDGPSGVVVSLVRRGGERSMASDRGAATELRADELKPAWFECGHLHVSGYALAVEPIRGAAARAVELAHGNGARISVDLAAATVIEAVGAAALRALLNGLAPDTVFCTEDEDKAIGGRIPGPVWIVKRGARGASADGVEHGAVPVADVVDATGAGDAFAAGWIVGGMPLALETAARCVAQVGAMPRTAASTPFG